MWNVIYIYIFKTASECCIIFDLLNFVCGKQAGNTEHHAHSTTVFMDSHLNRIKPYPGWLSG